MPVFHTKTIETILDPVAQQVSQLIVLYEEVEQGLEIPNLVQHIEAIASAVDNLKQVGGNLIESSKDEKLKAEMPLATEKIDSSTVMLLQAAEAIGNNTPDDTSDGGVNKRHLLIDGARGILAGVSTLLLIWDDSEVRKILDVCDRIIEYLAVVEQVETQEEVETVFQSLDAGMQNLFNQAQMRAEDLVDSDLRMLLINEIDTTKEWYSLLRSSMNMYISVKVSPSRTRLVDAQRSREQTVQALIDSIKELKRVIKLTSNAHLDIEALAMFKRKHKNLIAFNEEAYACLEQSGVSEQATKAALDSIAKCLTEHRGLVEALGEHNRGGLLEQIEEVAQLAQQLQDMQTAGTGTSVKAKELSALILEKLAKLDHNIKDAIIQEVVDNFRDPHQPLNALLSATNAPMNDPNREENWEKARINFEKETKKMLKTAETVATGISEDSQLSQDIKKSVGKLEKLTKQTIHASRVVLRNPDKKECVEHLEKLRAQWGKEMSHLTNLVDSATNPIAFAANSEIVINNKLQQAEEQFRQGNTQAGASKVTEASKAIVRLVGVANQEVENSSDPVYREKVQLATQTLQNSIGPLVVGAKQCVTRQGDELALAQYRTAATDVSKRLAQVREALCPIEPPPRPPLPNTSDLISMDDDDDDYTIGEEPIKEVNPVGFAAHQLTKEARQWDEKDNELIGLAKEMATMMKFISRYTNEENPGTKKELINTSKELSLAAEKIVKLSAKVANCCTDKRMQRNLNDVRLKIPTIATQLKIVSAVKAASLSSKEEDRDKEATEMLTENASNLMQSIVEVIRATESASIRVSPEMRAECGLTWRKKNKKGQTEKSVIT